MFNVTLKLTGVMIPVGVAVSLMLGNSLRSVVIKSLDEKEAHAPVSLFYLVEEGISAIFS